MLEPLIGSTNKERILIYLYCKGIGYGSQIAKFYEVGAFPIQKQLSNLEIGGVIYSKKIGKTITYQLNPRYPFYKELTALIEKSISLYPPEEKKKLLITRRRPRREGKPK